MVSECIEEGILAEFLSKNRAEAIKVSIYEYDQEKHIRQEREASREEGIREGIKEGIIRGRSELIWHALEKGVESESLKQLFDVTEEELETIQKEMTSRVMPVAEVIDKVAAICKAHGVKRLELFGSFATGTAASTSDIDFVVYGCEDVQRLEEALEEIDTLRNIDIFEYESISNKFLLEDIKKYGKQIY